MVALKKQHYTLYSKSDKDELDGLAVICDRKTYLIDTTSPNIDDLICELYNQTLLLLSARVKIAACLLTKKRKVKKKKTTH